MNFTGYGVMVDGQLSDGPAIFMTKDGRVFSYSKMEGGKPHGPGTTYNS